MTQYAKLPDGNYAKFPDDWTPQKIDTTLRADHPNLFKNTPALSDQHMSQQPPTSLTDNLKQTGSDIATGKIPSEALAGMVKGASRIGSTLLAPVDAAARKLGIQNDFIGRTDRNQAVDQFMNEHSDPSSVAYKAGDIGAQVAGTAGAGGVLGKGLMAVSKAPWVGPLVEALQSSGTAGKNLAIRVAGGASSGAAQTTMVDPKNAAKGAIAGGALPFVGPALRFIGRSTAELIGSLGTHTGAEGLKIAARAGIAGGKTAKEFAGNMRGDIPIQDVLDKVKSNISAMVSAKSAEYRQGMAAVSNDKSVLKFDVIDDAVKKAASIVSFKGQIKNVNAARVQQKIAKEINKWKSLDPAEFHTPEGLDALKQKIGGIVEGIPYEEKTTRMVGNNIYNAIKDEITKQAPTYSKVMKTYQDASSQIKEIERTLSQGKNASADTSIRKLQSLLRNNVNTNYGNRLSLAKTLEEKGGSDMMTSLAGQSLNTLTPRGLGGVVASATGMGGLYMHSPSVLPLLALQSPRLMGESALAAGRMYSLANQPAINESAAKSLPVMLNQQ